METLDQTAANELATWPPEYSLRISKKAKRVYLKIFPNRGLEIIVPFRQQKGFVVADLLAEKKLWIEKHLSKVKIPQLQPITQLTLNAIGQTWNIEYQQTLSKQLRHTIRPGTNFTTLTLYGDVSNIERNNLWLKKWLMQLAKKHLLPWLRSLSIKHQLDFNLATVRAQQTLWGSCNVQKNISLNYKLLFIPANLAEHIMLHELCHTKHLNHSQRFWSLLTKLDPRTDAHDHAVRKGDNFVPSELN